MTFSIHKLWMFNFRAYSGHHEFEFPTEPGLYFFSGANKVDDLGSNGAGKSTFLEAITWCLYGKTTRGLKANDIITWGLSTATVVLDLTVGDSRFKVKRSQKPNVLLLIEDGVEKPVDQEELEKHLRLNFKAFLSAVLSAQFGTSFFQLSPTEKLDLFSKIMELDYWLDKSEAANDWSKKLLAEIEASDRGLAKEQGLIDGIRDDMTALRDKAAAFEEEQAQRGAALYLEMRNKAKAIEKLEDSLKVTRKKRAATSAKLKEAVDKEQEALGYRDSILEFIQELGKTKAGIQAIKEERTRKLADFKKLQGACPICSQPVDAAHAKRHVKDVEASLATIDVKLEDIHNRIGKKTGVLIKAKTEYQLAALAAADCRREMSACDVAVTKAQGAIEAANAEYDRLQLEFDRSKGETNPYIQLIKQKKDQLAKSKQKLVTLEEAKAKLEAENEAVSYWVKGFKRIRLFIIEQAFQTLEVEVNNCLAALGMPDWAISFDVERENKSGGMTKGFTVLINSPRNTEPVKWESWSGGETQRLQLAGDLGLSNLIMSQAGLAGTVEFYDEPSTHLSKEGMLDLANMLHERAMSDKKQIWIIDHAAITNFGEFKGIIHAEKSTEGSSISMV